MPRHWSRKASALSCVLLLSAGCAKEQEKLLPLPSDWVVFGGGTWGVYERKPYVIRDGAVTLLNDSGGGKLGYGNIFGGSIVEAGGRLFFDLDDGWHGREPWLSDGTPGGTRLLKDIYPGLEGSASTFLAFGGKVLFSASDPDHGQELWISDGTFAGTTIVKDINPGAGGSRPNGLTVSGGKVYFDASDGQGIGLWVTDGSESGTTLVANIGPATDASSTILNDPREVNGKIYFVFNDGVHGSELWVTDGTATGTFMLKDIAPGLDSSFPNIRSSPTVSGGKLIFTVSIDGTNGEEPWVTDGTTAGTLLLKDIYPGPSGSSPAGLTEYNGRVYFSADDGTGGAELWSTDGTASGTTLLKDINLGAASSRPWGFIAFGDKLYFNACDGSGCEPWVSDGSSAGTTILKDINPGVGTSATGVFAVSGARLWFCAYDGVEGGLWNSDGTGAGTTLVKGLGPSLSSFVPLASIAWGPGRFSPFRFFVQQPEGWTLWTSDGSAGGTKIILNGVIPRN
jgi:ELWxxDGT repeat protein